MVILLIQIYTNNIIFGSTDETLCKEFVDIMKSEFEMSMIGQHNFVLSIQVKQAKTDTFIYQEKYTREF